MEKEHFKLKDLQEVKLFVSRLENFQESECGFKLNHIDLITAFEKLQDFEQGGRLFTALLDLKINVVQLQIDLKNAGGIWNRNFSKGKFEDGHVLDNQEKFNGKFYLQYYHSNFIPRFRAIWDKIMGIFILMYQPDSYDKFRKAKSRKKEFRKLTKQIEQIPDEFTESILKNIADFDHKFRTPEIHGTGTIRKWSFTMFSLPETPMIDLYSYWNWLLPTLEEIDRVIAA